MKPSGTDLGSATAVDAVAEQIRLGLYSGLRKPGEVLKDTDLVDTYGVARPTARAAVQVLVAEGLLWRDRGRSSRVPTYGAADIDDLFGARWVIEWTAVQHIVSSEVDLEPLRQALHHLEALTDSNEWGAAAVGDVAFHQAMVALTGSPRLNRMYSSLTTELKLMIALLKPAYESVADLVAEHHSLFAALQARDEQLCRRLLRTHYDDAVVSLKRTFT
jgi:DNA-binding GntR family transcriptional regulator